MDFPPPNQEIIERWQKITEFLGVPEVRLTKDSVRVIKNPLRDPDYSFGIILNENRSLRPLDALKNRLNCPLCGGLEDAKEEPQRRIDSDNELKGYVVVPNIFPVMKGHSLAITIRTKDEEKPMYTIKRLDGVSEEMGRVFSYCKKIGFQAFHNGEGAGASIPNHEHWHLTNWYDTFSAAGETYGFERADTEKTQVKSVRRMPGFPFAHLIFQQDEPDRITNFLFCLESRLNGSYGQDFVPHIVCQGAHGILVAPFKHYAASGGIGSGDVAGHIVFKNRQEFERADYLFCVGKLGKQLFRKEELDLSKFL